MSLPPGLIPHPSRIIRTIGLFVMDHRFDLNFAIYAIKMNPSAERNSRKPAPLATLRRPRAHPLWRRPRADASSRRWPAPADVRRHDAKTVQRPWSENLPVQAKENSPALVASKTAPFTRELSKPLPPPESFNSLRRRRASPEPTSHSSSAWAEVRGPCGDVHRSSAKNPHTSAVLLRQRQYRPFDIATTTA
jgi:hypothetical protein